MEEAMTTAVVDHPDVHDVVAAARRLAPQIIAVRDEAEQTRRTPPTLAKAIADAGLYQMFLPRSVGGMELAPLVAFEAVEELSKHDGSVGWCAMIASAASSIAGWLPTDSVQKMAGTPPDLRVAGSLRPQGQAWPVDGGYRVKGQWNFASGIDHANWLYCPTIIMAGDKPVITQAGAPKVRAMWIPTTGATIVDTWSVIGMRGTGSQDFVIDDVFVPEELTCFIAEQPVEKGPLYNPRTLLTVLFAVTVGNALGIARGAIETFVDIATRDASTGSTTLLRDRPFVQSRLAEAEAIVNAARAYVVDAVETVWKAICLNEQDPTRKIANARLAITHAMHEAVRAVDIVFHAAGTNAIYTRNPLERHFRDIHVAVQHNSAFPAHYESAGKVLMGLKPSDPGW
jgi:alkylation response protein AidB-like acyl-CoA dehydrogenase